MLADPQTIDLVPIGGGAPVPMTLAKTSAGPNQNIYTGTDGTTTMTTKQNQSAKRFRREIRLSQTKVAADPISAVNAESGVSVYLVIDEPKSGVFSDEEIKILVESLRDWATWTNLDKLLVGEF